MQAEELKQLISKIQSQKTESQTIELKSAEHGCPTKLYDTLSAFSNQDEGGILIFGVDEKSGYKINGVYDTQDLQKKVTEQCKQMEPAMRALFTVCKIDSKTIVSAEIPSVDISERPVFYRGVGRIRGSYIRVGESDEPMSEYEIYSYEAFRKRIRDDLRPVGEIKAKFLNTDRLTEYLTAVKHERKNLAEHLSDREILELLGVTSNSQLTLAGLLTFARYPQACFPQLCITAISLPGTEIGELGNEEERFLDSERITGSISDMLEEAVDFVRRNSRTKTIIDNNGRRLDKPEYPLKAVREAILNALVHRDYSVYTENIPIRLEMYRDRMEINNSGSLYGRLKIDNSGKVRPDTRNAALANMLELLKVTENRYSGIPTMRHEFAAANLPLPIFYAKQGEFKVVMYNSIVNKDNTSEEAILEYCRQPRNRTELTEFLGKSRNFVMSKIIQPLVESGKLELTLPDKPKSSKQKYVASTLTKA